MNDIDIFREAYALFQEIDGAETDADIIWQLTEALQDSYNAGFSEGVITMGDEEQAREAEYAKNVEIGEALMRDFEKDTFFSDDVDHFGSDMTLDEIEAARNYADSLWMDSEEQAEMDARIDAEIEAERGPRFPSATYTR